MDVTAAKRPLPGAEQQAAWHSRALFGLALSYTALASYGLTLTQGTHNTPSLWPLASVLSVAFATRSRGFNWLFFSALLSLIAMTASRHTDSDLLPLSALLIASTTVASAVLQAVLLRRYLKPLTDGRILREIRVLSRLLLAPLTCLLPASVGIGALYSLVPDIEGTLLGNWLLWWSTDTLGVLLVLPLMSAYLRDVPLSARLWLANLLLPFVVVVLSCTGAVLMAHWEQARLLQQTADRSSGLQEYLENLLSRQQDATQAVAALFTLNRPVSATEFDAFTQHFIEEGWVKGLAWVPVVPHAERSQLEAAAAEQGLYERFTEQATGYRQRSAISRDRYYPFHYVHSQRGHSLALGLDLSSESHTLVALGQARDEAQPVLAERRAFYDQDATRPDDWRLFMPVYQMDADTSSTELRRQSLKGYAVTVLYLEEINAELAKLAAEYHLDVTLLFTLADDTASQPVNSPAIPFQWQGPWLELANGRFQLITSALQPWNPTSSPLLPLYLIGTMLATLFASAFIIVAVDQRQRITQAVTVRTLALKQAHREIENLLNNINLYVVALAPDGRVLRVNTSARQRFQLETAARYHLPLTHTRWYRSMHQEQRLHFERHLRAAQSGRQSRFDFSTRPHGQRERILDTTLSPVIDPHTGNVECMVISAIDISLRKRLERRLLARSQQLEHARVGAEQASRAKSNFLACMSHEIRTPLNGIIGMLDALSYTSLTEQQREMLNLSRLSNTVLLNIINDILDFSKIEAGKLTLDIQPLNLAELIATTCEMQKAVAHQQSGHLCQQIDPQLSLPLKGDGLRIRQILLNLISNAIKFSAPMEAPQVEVCACLADQSASQVWVELTVSDNGIGIDAQQQANLFQPFTQADGSITRRFGGTGLGLSICHFLVELMHGEITVDSQPGRGCSFHVRLPLELSNPAALAKPDAQPLPDSAAAPVLSAPTSSDGATQQHRLLVAEDSDINQKVLRHQLTQLGYSADFVPNGLEALRRLECTPYALLLTDLQMPEMDGYALAETIRAREPIGTHLPIIALTANALSCEAERCQTVGIDEYLTKPLSLTDLQIALRRRLEETSN